VAYPAARAVIAVTRRAVSGERRKETLTVGVMGGGPSSETAGTRTGLVRGRQLRSDFEAFRQSVTRELDQTRAVMHL
jgi:hypothetical protein